MKKIIGLVLFFALSFCLFVGCNSEQVLYDSFNCYLDDCITNLRNRDISDGKDPANNVGIKTIEETTFTLSDVKFKGNTATATIEITNKNFNRVLYRAQAVAVQKCPVYADDDTISLYFIDATWEAYRTEEEETRKGTIIFNKINDKWCIDSNTDIVYLLFGSDL